MNVQIQLMLPEATAPSRGTPGAAGLDLYASDAVTIRPNARKLVPTGIAVGIPADHVGLIWPRSGLAVKHGIDVLAGVIDCDYRGEVKVALINHGESSVEIETGDRIAQLVIQQYSASQVMVVSHLGQTHRGERGFGSTG